MGFLSSLFGPSKDEIWSQVANEINGEFIDGGFWNRDQLIYDHGEWTIVLDTFSRGSGKNSRTYTRMRAPFINKDDFQFQIYREGIFSPLGKWLGGQDIIIGDQYFDDEFIIKGNDEEKIKLLLHDERIKDLLSFQPDVDIKIDPDDAWIFKQYPDGVDALYYECRGTITTKEDLKNLFELFCLILNRLVKIDSAYEDDPGVTL